MPVGGHDYLQTHPTLLADLAVFDEWFFPPGSFCGRESPDAIIKDAVAKARQAITFYQGLKGFACDDKARAVLDRIIAEEEHYIDALEMSPDIILSAPDEKRPMGS
jgi:hypothetical protein